MVKGMKGKPLKQLRVHRLPLPIEGQQHRKMVATVQPNSVSFPVLGGNLLRKVIPSHFFFNPSKQELHLHYLINRALGRLELFLSPEEPP